jgi:hypothetical protein
MQFDVAEVLRHSLDKMGYTGSKFEFDAHSTIEIELENIPSLFISVINERVWLWSRLTWMGSNTLTTWGGELLLELQEALPSVVTGQPILGHGEDGYELKALIDEYCFQQETGLEALLEAFFLLCQRLQERFSRLG